MTPPTIAGGLAGDLLANLQLIEFNTLEFYNAPGFMPENNAQGIRLINQAILGIFEDRATATSCRAGDWDPELAINIMRGAIAVIWTRVRFRRSMCRLVGAAIQTILSNQCVTCHSQAGGDDGIATHYEPCRSSQINGFDFLYRSVLTRVNFTDSASSLILRKPTDGATSLLNRDASAIAGYHAGGLVLDNDVEISKVISWILNGAPRGNLPAGAPAASAGKCF